MSLIQTCSLCGHLYIGLHINNCNGCSLTERVTMSNTYIVSDEKRFWLIWNADTTGTHVRHTTQSQAETELERLANNNPGQTFYILRADYKLRIPPVYRTRIEKLS